MRNGVNWKYCSIDFYIPNRVSIGHSPKYENIGPGRKPPPGTLFRPKMWDVLRAYGTNLLSQLWRRRRPPARHRSLSLLELLPNELLQPIYVFSLYGNGRWLLSLPNASYYLGRALSTEDVYVEILLAGFSCLQIYTPPDYIQQLVSYQNLPKRLLRLPWFSSRLIRLAHVRYLTRMVLMEYYTFAAETKKQVDRSITREIRTAIEASMDNCGSQSPTAYSIGDESSFTISIGTQPMIIEVETYLPTKRYTQISTIYSFMGQLIASYSDIPRKFLCPPWTEDKCSILEALLVGCARMAPTDHEYAVAGLENAVRMGNLRAVTALLSRLEPTDPQRWPGDQFGCFSASEKGHSCNILCSRFKGRSLGLGVTRELLRIAILEAPFDARIVNCLLHARCDSSLGRKAALLDDDLLEWATRESTAGGKMGSWLLSTIVVPGL